MPTVRAKGSGYSKFADESVAAQNTYLTEMKQLLPHCADGVKINSSTETAMAGFGENDDGARSFMINE